MNPYAIPPTDMIMPDTAELWLTLLWGFLALLTIAGCIRLSVQSKNWLPICLLIGSALSMFGESLVIPNMNYWYPAIGQLNAYQAYGQSVPLFAAFAYIFYFAPGIFWMLKKFDEGISPRHFWIIWAGLLAFTIVYEIITLGIGVCTYYGDQYFKIWKLPLLWPTLNSMIIVCSSIALYFARPHLKGWRVLLVIPFMACQIATVEVLVGYPAFVANHADVPGFVRFLSVCWSFAMCLIVVWIGSQLVCRTKAKAS